MAKLGERGHTAVIKRSSQGRKNTKTSTMPKAQKRTFKVYRGQGK
jgi:hypothetical protein